jgi:hypothetical protein
MKITNMDNFSIIITAIASTTSFWLGFYVIQMDKAKDREKRKIEKLFRDKKW